MQLKWNYNAPTQEQRQAAEELGAALGISPMLAKVLIDRGDYDVDGCTVVALVYRFLLQYYSNIEYYVPDRYDKAWRDKLAPYIKNLNDFRCETDENGDLIPCYIPESVALEEYLDNLTGERNAEMVDDVYEDYGRRCRVMTVKKMITLYIAHGCHWLPEFDAFARWMFDYSMWCKMAFFYSKSSETFKSEKIGFKGHWSPLKLMHKTFSLSEFTAVCQKHGDKMKQSPLEAIWKYKTRGLIAQQGDKYTISDAFCKKHGIV